jgi:uncharacterized protein (AIM24 family)
MPDFQVHTLEGTQFVEVHLNNETFRAEAGALAYFTGDIEMRSRVIPSLLGLVKSVLADEAIFRPTYTGTGVVTLESSFGGFHILDLDGKESWILEPGAYWASDASVDVTFFRESFVTAYWAGEGLVYLQTQVKGSGKVVLTTPGPVEEITLEKGKKVAVEGRAVICRTNGVTMTIRRPTKNYLGKFTAGEQYLRVYEGEGKIILNPAPYWRYRMMQDINNNSSNSAVQNITIKM